MKMNKQLAEFDLNLMKLLKAVVETKNTHAAAEQLGISQTSVSRGLAKLKETFGKQLFLRKAHGVEPSELAEKLAEAADEMLIPIIKVMESYNSFDPQSFDGKLSIAVNTYLLELFGDRLLQTLQKALPKARLELDYWQAHSLADMLNGQIDYALQLSNFPFPQAIYNHQLKDVEINIVARKNHPILSHSSEFADIHQLPVVLLYLTGVNYNISNIEKVYNYQGYKIDFILKTHSLKAALYTLQHSDAICFATSYISELAADLSSYPMPQLPEQNGQITIVGAYLQTRRGYPLNQFLHQTMQALFDEIIPPESNN